jgi:hypothetical protein
VLPTFITLTYHDVVPGPLVAKRKHLEQFRRALLVAYPHLYGLWKLEPQKRGAPHFHLIIYGCTPRLDWVVRTWHKIAGFGSEKHLRWHLGELGNGNRPCVERASSWRRVGAYLSKYFSKPVHGPEWIEFGRAWGQLGKLNRSRYVTMVEHEGTIAGAEEYDRRTRKERIGKNKLRWVLKAAVREGGQVSYSCINVAKLAILLGPCSDPDARPSLWSHLLGSSPLNFDIDFSDRLARKAFRRSLFEPDEWLPGNVRLSLKYCGSKSWGSRRRRPVDGVEKDVVVHRPCRTRYGASSESLRLWQWAECRAEAKRLELVEWYVSRGSIGAVGSRAPSSPCGSIGAVGSRVPLSLCELRVALSC